MAKKPFDKVNALALVPVLALVLFIIHGLEQIHFRIDIISLGLLIIALIPFLRKHLETVKAGELELSFRALSQAEQIFMFLKSIGKDHRLTFYAPRARESRLGIAGRYLVEEMYNDDRGRLIAEIKNWLSGDDDGLRWLSSEIIGYFSLSTLTESLKETYSGADTNIDWHPWQLNCLWAHSKVDNNYQEMHKFLMDTKSASNQNWLLDVYVQMPDEGHADHAEFARVIQKFKERSDMALEIKKKAEEVLQSLGGNRQHRT